MARGHGRGVSLTTRRPARPPEGADAPAVDAAARLGAGPGARLGAGAPPADAAGAETGRSTLERISSLGPKAWTRPSAIISTRSTLASALGRWATTITTPPRARTPTIA